MHVLEQTRVCSPTTSWSVHPFLLGLSVYPANWQDRVSSEMGSNRPHRSVRFTRCGLKPVSTRNRVREDSFGRRRIPYFRHISLVCFRLRDYRPRQRQQPWQLGIMETSVGRTTIKARDVRLASELTQRTNESPAKLICRRPESRKQSFNGATDELQPTDSTGLSLNILHSPRSDVRNARQTTPSRDTAISITARKSSCDLLQHFPRYGIYWGLI